MEPGRPSVTAERAALLRAVHQRWDRPLVFDDPLAARLLDDTARAALEDPAPFETPALRGLRASIAARSRYAEDCLLEDVRRGTRQYVILGAGLDSFAYRAPAEAAAVRVFEVDHPATQAWKRQRLADAGIATPALVVYVPIDFEHETIAAALARAGFDAAAPAFVSWLGVTVYLTRDAVLDTLGWAAGLAPGSTIVFTYGVPTSSLPPRAGAALAAMAARAAAAGEPWQTYFEPPEMAAELARLGFGRVEDVGPRESTGRYFRERSDDLRPGHSGHLVRASTASG